MKNTDKATLTQMAQLASAHVKDERDFFFEEVDRLLDESEAEKKSLVKPREERD